MPHHSPGALQYLIPILVLLPVLYFRMRRLTRPRPLKWRYLWVRPAIFLILAAFVIAMKPPPAPDWPWFGVAAILGSIAGWQWGRTMAIEMHPENDTLMAKGGQAATLVIVVLVVLRLGLKAGLQMEASSLHIDAILITDASIVFSALLFAVRGLEMFLRARRVMDKASA